MCTNVHAFYLCSTSSLHIFHRCECVLMVCAPHYLL